MTTTDITAAEAALAQLDPKIGRLIHAHGPVNRLRPGPYFTNLARAIIGQQISIAAAASIYARVEAATQLDPHRLIALSPEELRALGLSGAKASYLHDLAEHFVRDAAVFDHLDTLPDDAVIAELTSVKGIGVWTAQMFLMFTLGRPDVFAPDDVGLQRAIKQLYGLDHAPSKTELETISNRWRPYRTVACWHLWQSLRNAPA